MPRRAADGAYPLPSQPYIALPRPTLQGCLAHKKTPPGGASKSRFRGQCGAMPNLDLPGRQIWGHVLGLVRGKGGHPLTGVRFRTLSTNIMHDYTGRVIGREERDVISFGNCCGLAPVQELHASRCPFLVRLSNVFFHTSHPTQRSNLNSQHISKVPTAAHPQRPQA